MPPRLRSMGAFGGRLDQQLQHLNILFQHPQLSIVLADAENTCCLLPKGEHRVWVDNRAEGPHCGAHSTFISSLPDTCAGGA